MISIKTPEEIKILREGGKKLASVLYSVAKMAKPGIKTIDLDKEAERLIREAGGEPAFKNYKTKDDKIPFPASLCVSVNDEVVHGIPSQRILKRGDIVSLDSGMKYKGLYTDMTITVGVGKISKRNLKLIETAEKALNAGIAVARDGARIGDIGFAIQSFVEKSGFNVVRTLVGHGVGYKAHEEPEVPNFGKKGTGEILKSGMVLALEPMVVTGKPDVFLDDDQWTWKTFDGSFAAEFEHTIVITKKGAEILTCLPAVGRLMGIDYGEKRVGIAISDEGGSIAMPYAVLKNDKNILNNIREICTKRNIKKMVIGLSLDFKGQPNFIVQETNKLKTVLEKDLNIPVSYEPEVLTTKEAERLQGKVEKIDASAAALILKSFIDKQKMV